MENKYWIGKSSITGNVVLFTGDGCGFYIHVEDGYQACVGDFQKLIKQHNFKNITANYLRNTKIRIASPEHSEFVQKLVFGAGGKWIDDFEGQQVTQFLEKPFVVVDGNLQIAHLERLREDLFIESNNKEIKLPMPPKQASDEWPKVGDEVMCFNCELNMYLKVKVLDAKTGSDEFAVASITKDGSYASLWWGCKFKPLPTPLDTLSNSLIPIVSANSRETSGYAAEQIAKAILAGEIDGLVYKGD